MKYLKVLFRQKSHPKKHKVVVRIEWRIKKIERKFDKLIITNVDNETPIIDKIIIIYETSF